MVSCWSVRGSMFGSPWCGGHKKSSSTVNQQMEVKDVQFHPAALTWSRPIVHTTLTKLVRSAETDDSLSPRWRPSLRKSKHRQFNSAFHFAGIQNTADVTQTLTWNMYVQVYTIQIRKDLFLWCLTLRLWLGYKLNISHYTPNFLSFLFFYRKIIQYIHQ